MLNAFRDAARSEHLDVFGMLHAQPTDGIGTGTLVLLGPQEPGFWPHLTASPEWQDKGADPIDRWSTRVISKLAEAFSGSAHFPFGTPVRPFMSWAIRSGRAWSSPVHLLVHDTAGLLVSYRGAVLLPDLHTLPEPAQSPCLGCADRPCVSACPAHALTPKDYDLAACHTYLDSSDGQTCMENGCSVRRSCPISVTYGRMEAQSAFHMERFHR